MKYIITESKLGKLIDTYLTEYLLKDIEEDVEEYKDFRYWRDKNGDIIMKYSKKEPNVLSVFYNILHDLDTMFGLSIHGAGQYVKRWMKNKYRLPEGFYIDYL